MKNLRVRQRPFIIVLSASLISIFLYLLCDRKTGASPIVEFKGYESHRTNRNVFAEFELRNVTARPIWLFFGGTNFPLDPPIIQRPLVKLPEPTNVYSLTAGSFFMNGQKVPPGECFRIDFPLTPNSPMEQVGIYYYTGN